MKKSVLRGCYAHGRGAPHAEGLGFEPGSLWTPALVSTPSSVMAAPPLTCSCLCGWLRPQGGCFPGSLRPSQCIFTGEANRRRPALRLRASDERQRVPGRGFCPQGWHRLVRPCDHQALECKIGSQRHFFTVRFKYEHAWRAIAAGYSVSSDHSDFRASQLV